MQKNQGRSAFRKRDSESPGIRLDMFEVDHHLGPVAAQPKPLGPFDNHHGWFGKGILEGEGLHIVKPFDAVKVHMVDLDVIMKHVNERESRAGDVFFSRYSKSANDAFGDGRLAAAKVAR